jgi:hypothetical protein
MKIKGDQFQRRKVKKETKKKRKYQLVHKTRQDKHPTLRQREDKRKKKQKKKKVETRKKTRKKNHKKTMKKEKGKKKNQSTTLSGSTPYPTPSYR